MPKTARKSLVLWFSDPAVGRFRPGVNDIQHHLYILNHFPYSANPSGLGAAKDAKYSQQTTYFIISGQGFAVRRKMDNRTTLVHLLLAKDGVLYPWPPVNCLPPGSIPVLFLYHLPLQMSASGKRLLWHPPVVSQLYLPPRGKAVSVCYVPSRGMRGPNLPCPSSCELRPQ